MVILNDLYTKLETEADKQRKKTRLNRKCKYGNLYHTEEDNNKCYSQMSTCFDKLTPSKQIQIWSTGFEIMQNTFFVVLVVR